MHTDVDEKTIARRLAATGDESSEAPYDWVEFQRRRQRSALTRLLERNRPAAIAAAVLAAVLVTAVPWGRWTTARKVAMALPERGQRSGVSDRRDLQEQARTTRALEGWLADLPHDPSMVRVGRHAAVSGLQDQIAAVDALMSAEHAVGAQPALLDALRRQRAQLVDSLAQVQYAEMLASATL